MTARTVPGVNVPLLLTPGSYQHAELAADAAPV